MVKFGGYFGMKKLASVKFEYDDGSTDEVMDPRAALLFQSRANSCGLLSGIEDYVMTTEAPKDEAKQAK